jgi:hypothetical protein
MMDQTKPIDVVKAFCARSSVPCLSAKLARVHTQKHLWFFTIVTGYAVEIDTGDGVAIVCVTDQYDVDRVHYEPPTTGGWLLPLWVAFPMYSSMTSFWRCCSGEDYKYKWHAWYRGLSEVERSNYKKHFPAPTDPERAWEGWYEEVADQPAGAESPVADFILGQVPAVRETQAVEKQPRETRTIGNEPQSPPNERVRALSARLARAMEVEPSRSFWSRCFGTAR